MTSTAVPYETAHELISIAFALGNDGIWPPPPEGECPCEYHAAPRIASALLNGEWNFLTLADMAYVPDHTNKA